MKCKSCGCEIPDDAKVCPFCGKSVTEEKKEVYCHSCGTKAPDGAVYCPNCGKPLNEIPLYYEPKRNDTEQDPAKVLGILSLVFAFVMPLVGIILGIIAIVKGSEVEKSSGKIMGIVGIIAAIVLTIVNIGIVSAFIDLIFSYLPEIPFPDEAPII